MPMINLTPHLICIITNGDRIELPPSGTMARVACEVGARLGDGAYCPICGRLYDPAAWGEDPLEGCECALPHVLFSAPKWGEVQGLPAPTPGTIYIVSALVAARCIGREDVFSPGTGPNDGAERDAQGRITAVTRLIQAPPR